MTPVDIYILGVLCQNFVYLSQFHWLQNIWRVSPLQLFYCLQGNNYKRVGPRGTNNHWVNPCQFILAVWKEIISRESAIGALSPIGLTHGNFFNGCKAIISRDPYQGALIPIVLIPSFFNCLKGNNIQIFVSRGTKSHWVDPYQFFYWM